MKDVLLTKLRDVKTPLKEFRESAFQLGLLLAGETTKLLKKVDVDVTTSLATTKGAVASWKINRFFSFFFLVHIST